MITDYPYLELIIILHALLAIIVILLLHGKSKIIPKFFSLNAMSLNFSLTSVGIILLFLPNLLVYGFTLIVFAYLLSHETRSSGKTLNFDIVIKSFLTSAFSIVLLFSIANWLFYILNLNVEAKSLIFKLTVGITAFFLTSYRIISSAKNLKRKPHPTFNIASTDIVFILMLFLVAIGSISLCNRPKLIGDMYFHYDLSLKMANNENIVTNYPWFFPSFLSSIYPSMTTETGPENHYLSYISLLPLEAIIILASLRYAAVYLLNSTKSRNIVSRHKEVLIANYLSLSLGFGWIIYLVFGFYHFLRIAVYDDPVYQIHLLTSTISSKTYDVFDFRQLFLPDIVAPFWFISVPSLILLLTFILDRRAFAENKKLFYILMVTNILCSPFTLVELNFNLFIALVIAHMYKYNEFLTHTKILMKKCIPISLLVILPLIITDIFSPYKFLFNDLSKASKPIDMYLFYISSLVLLLLLTTVLSRYNYKIQTIFTKIKRFLSRGRTISILGYSIGWFYVFSLIVYIVHFNQVDAQRLVPDIEVDPFTFSFRPVSLGYYVIPWYVLPVRYGVLLLIPVLYACWILKSNNLNFTLTDRNFKVYSMLISCLLLLIIEALSFALFDLGLTLPVYRLSSLIHVQITILASIAICKVTSAKKWTVGMKILILFVIMNVVFSNLIYYQSLYYAFR